MASLTTWSIENARSDRKSQNFDDTRDLGAIALRSENWSVLEEIMRIEIAFPPLRLSTQKNTGSRYAPKTSSIAARISYSVQYERAASRMWGIMFSFVLADVRRVASASSARP